MISVYVTTLFRTMLRVWKCTYAFILCCGQVVNPNAGAKLIFLLGLSVYLGNFMKDFVCAPRPREMAETLGKGQSIKYLACNDAHARESAKAWPRRLAFLLHLHLALPCRPDM